MEEKLKLENCVFNYIELIYHQRDKASRPFKNLKNINVVDKPPHSSSNLVSSPTNLTLQRKRQKVTESKAVVDAASQETKTRKPLKAVLPEKGSKKEQKSNTLSSSSDERQNKRRKSKNVNAAAAAAAAADDDDDDNEKPTKKKAKSQRLSASSGMFLYFLATFTYNKII